MIRVFVSLKIAEDVKEELKTICSDLAEEPEHYKWESNEKIHLTLKFIGDVADNLIPPISNELEFVKTYPALDFSITKFGFFYRNGIAKILWAGLKTDSTVYKLVKELNYRLEKFDIKIEKRKFKPHLTLLRIKSTTNEDFINNFNNYVFENVNFKADRIALVKSELFKEGAKYSDLKLYELN